MEVLYVPAQCKGENPTFKGNVLVRAPSFDERFEYLEVSGFQVDADGTVNDKMKQLKSIRKTVQLAKPHCLKVDIEHIESGAKFDSYEALTMNPICDTILMELGSLMVAGITPGKN